MRQSHRIVFVFLLLTITTTAAAQSAKTDGADIVIGQNVVRIPRVSRPPQLEEFADMQPQGAGKELVKITGFTQNRPSDGAPPSQPTEAYLGYDSKNIYVVFVCFNDPRKILAHFMTRDNNTSDDFVELTLDTFGDQRHGFLFGVNPLGVQSDGLWTEPSQGPDFSFDTVWDSRGKLTERGYIVWMSIPFRSLRFRREAGHRWGFTLMRSIQRNNEMDFWPHVSSRIAGRLTQEGTLQGLEGISPGHNMQFNPYVLPRAFRALDVRDPSNPTFDRARARFREGLDSKFVFKDKLVLDTTVNPDFSQVESDQPQNTVNQRFAVFFPEKRPFFLENSNYFDIQPPNIPVPNGANSLVFTRNIQDPEYGARLTGKIGPYALAFLTTDDRGPGESVANRDPEFHQRAYFAIAHVTREVGSQSAIGLIYTDREFFHGWNRVGGLDGNLKLDRNWQLSFRAVNSSTMSTDGKYAAGPYYEANFSRQGRQFNYDLLLQDISPGFQTQVGFVPRNDIRRAFQYAGYMFRPEGERLIATGPEMNAEVDYDHRGTMVQYNLSGDWAFELKHATTFSPIYQLEVDTLRPQDFPGLTQNVKFARDGAGLMLNSQPLRKLNLQMKIIDAGGINVVPPKGQLPVLGNELSVNEVFRVYATSRLEIENTYILDRVTANRGRNAAFNNHIFRSQWNYQFTPALSLRFIGQYNNLLANPRYTSLQTTKDLNFDLLITYLVHPGTAVYVGYNSNLENLDPALCLRIAAGPCDPNNPSLLRSPTSFINDGRQFFVKVSYLFRP